MSNVKKSSLISLCLLMVSLSLFPVLSPIALATADETTSTETGASNQATEDASSSSVYADDTLDLKITSDYAILIDADTGQVLKRKNEQKPAEPASTTKIMTAILVLENVEDLNELVTIGSELNNFTDGSSLMGIIEGEQIRVIDLLYGLLLKSGNDAASSLAIHVSGSENDFVDLMNAKAATLGMTGTHFANPHGLHNDNHYSTALDLATLMQYAMKNETFRGIVSTPDYTTPPTNKHESGIFLETSNRFLSRAENSLSYNWKPVTGGKTGYTSAAGACLVTSASENGVNLISVILHDTSKNSTNRWSETRELLEYGFANMQSMPLSDLNLQYNNTNPETVAVRDASRNDPQSGMLELNIQTDNVFISGLTKDLEALKADASNYRIAISINKDGANTLSAPIQVGDICGTATFLDVHTGRTLAVADLVASRSVDSIESDVKNPVDSLIQNVIIPETQKSSKGPIIVIILIIILIFLLIVFFVRKQHIDKKKKRRTKKAISKRQRGYYDYHNSRSKK